MQGGSIKEGLQHFVECASGETTLQRRKTQVRHPVPVSGIQANNYSFTWTFPRGKFAGKLFRAAKSNE